MDRRKFLTIAASAALMTFLARKAGAMGLFGGKKKDESKIFPFTLSDEEWRKRLGPEAYNVLRRHTTERAFTSPLYEERRAGLFCCAGCDWELFSSEHKFDSGTGWPSFWQPANDGAVEISEDNTLFVTRTEVHCSNCGGHQGHVFNDGPQPTGLRYCINGVALKFAPASG